MFSFGESMNDPDFQALFNFESNLISGLFDLDFNKQPECVLINVPDGDHPCTEFDNKGIQTTVKRGPWYTVPQYVYQISHELCHYVFRCQKRDRYQSVWWFEELLCESVSLVVLEITSQSYVEQGILSDEIWKGVFELYLSRTLSEDDRNSGLAECTTLQGLKEINDRCWIERESRKNQRDVLYGLFLEHRGSLHALKEYPRYIGTYLEGKGITVDFGRWISETNEPEFITRLSEVHPVLEGDAPSF